MNKSVRAIAAFGVVYAITGVATAALAGQATTHQAVLTWRWIAWLVSAIAFASHIGYEMLRLRTSPRVTALRASCAAAIGAFGLAVSANLHAQALSPPRHSVMLLLSLAIWPVITALPAFVVGFVAAWLLSRVQRSSPASRS